MNTNPSNNIFDVAAKKGQPPPKKQPVSPPNPEIQPNLQNKEPLSETDIEKMFDRLKEMKNDLDTKTDELRDTLSSSPKEVVQFFSNPKNFTIDQWNVIQNNRSELEKRTWAVVGKDPKIVREKQIEDKSTKARKAKSLGTRHNWIPMR